MLFYTADPDPRRSHWDLEMVNTRLIALEAKTARIGELYEAVSQLEKHMADLQTTIDTDTATITGMNDTLAAAVPDITTGFATLETEIATLKAGFPSADLTKLEAGLATLKTGIGSLAGLVPADAIPAPVVTPSSTSHFGNTPVEAALLAKPTLPDGTPTPASGAAPLTSK